MGRCFAAGRVRMNARKRRAFACMIGVMRSQDEGKFGARNYLTVSAGAWRKRSKAAAATMMPPVTMS